MEIINGIQIIEILNTNSIPIKILGDDFDVYYAKTIFKTHPPLEDIINELIGNIVYRIWGIQVPEIKIVKINNTLLQEYLHTNQIRSRYSNYNVDNLFIIGSKEIKNQTELDYHNLTITTKNDFNKYLNPLRFLDIAHCDVWLGNKDRRIKNSNLLLVEENNKLDFVAIDHTQLFANQNQYKALKLSLMDSEYMDMLIRSEFTEKICKFAEKDVISNFNTRIFSKIEETLDILPNLLRNFPSEIGLSMKGKNKIIEILENVERNNRISNLLNNRLL